MSLVSSSTVPLCGLCIVLWNALIAFVVNTNVVLGLCKSLVGGLDEPVHCLFVVQRNGLTMLAVDADAVL